MLQTNSSYGKLYLIPTSLGETEPNSILPISVTNNVEQIQNYIVENEKTARKFIKRICPTKVQSSLKINILNKHTQEFEHKEMLKACFEGENIGLLSEAGCPGIADPGAAIISIAHKNEIRIVPLVGPSSILLAMMSSGLNGQNFAFNGYLPIEKTEKKIVLKNLEKLSREKNQSQIFIETPYRNNKIFDEILQALHPSTQLCIATDITLETEYIKTKKILDWKNIKIDLHNRPSIFIIHA